MRLGRSRLGQSARMNNPAAQPRRLFLASLVLAALLALVGLLYAGEPLRAVVVGAAAVALLVATARPKGSA